MPQVGRSQRRTRRRPVLRAGLVVALSLLLGGCAYFNTFYHAKKYYAQGERARIAAEKKGQIAANNEAYKKCIDKCKRLIETYPDSKWQDDAHLLMAKAAYGRQDYLSAETTLRHRKARTDLALACEIALEGDVPTPGSPGPVKRPWATPAAASTGLGPADRKPLHH